MKAIFISIALCIVYSVSLCQPLSALRSPIGIKPVVGEMVTFSNAGNLEERTHKLLKYTTPDGGQGTFLKYAGPDQSPSATVEKTSSTLIIVPNPNNGHFTISISNAGIASGHLFIYDMLGVLVMSTPLNNSKSTVINLTEYPSGVYFIKCISGDQVLNQRMVKQ